MAKSALRHAGKAKPGDVLVPIYLLPRLQDLKPQTVVVPILLLHSFRHLGLMFLTSGATYAGIPPEFAYPAAFGDLLAAVLALTAVFVVTKNPQQVGLWYGSSTWREHWTCWWQSLWQPFTTHSHTWVQPIGYRPSGFLRYWSRITSPPWCSPSTGHDKNDPRKHTKLHQKTL